MTLNRSCLPPFVPVGVRILVAGVLLSTIGPPGSPVRAAQDPAGDIAAPLQESAPDAEETPPDAPPAEAALAGPLKALTDRLERDYPDREAIVRGGDALPRALLEFAEKHTSGTEMAGDERLAADVGRALQLAAEAYLVLDLRTEALRLYGQLASAGPLDTHRALGLFVLGEDQFLRERYVSSARRRGADYYWSLLTARFPGSEWALRVERPMRYIGFLKGGRKAPEFAATFEQAALPGQPLETRTYSSEGLRGQVVLIEFWRAGDPGRGERVKTLASGLASNLKEYPDLVGKVQALGVNLDTSRELFDAAITAWGTPWPELHDGLGFRSPLADAFGIPRVPQWIVIEASGGRVVHVGSDFDRFLAAASQELRRVRGVEE